MKILISSEESIGVGNKTNVIYEYLEPIIEKLNNNYYGSEFDMIGIVPTIMENEFLDENWKERRLVRSKSKDADIRLIMDYNKFVNTNDEGRILLYVKMLVDSIKIIDAKKKGDFNGVKLIEDLLAATNIKWDEIKDLDELDPRYPFSKTVKENCDVAKQK